MIFWVIDAARSRHDRPRSSIDCPAELGRSTRSQLGHQRQQRRRVASLNTVQPRLLGAGSRAATSHDDTLSSMAMWMVLPGGMVAGSLI